ncbi:hypothetical protein [Dactylosporangium darangshiense]|uniref:hypothetical protein n=1 Tax=Dactylosporangium darangshiense TaxID=579108 RepID=UPI003639334D
MSEQVSGSGGTCSTSPPNGSPPPKPRRKQLRARLGDVAILRERRNGVSRPLPLRELRRRATPIPASGDGHDATANRNPDPPDGQAFTAA